MEDLFQTRAVWMGVRDLFFWLLGRGRQDPHMVVRDCTLGYSGNPFVPFGILKAHSDFRHTLGFMAFLREPLTRARPHYYQFAEYGVLTGACRPCTPKQLPKIFTYSRHKRITTCSMGNGDCYDIFQDSMRVDFFGGPFKNPDSFSSHVGPVEQAVLHEVVGYAWEIWNVARGTGKKINLVGGGNRMNHHEHSTLHRASKVRDARQNDPPKYVSFLVQMIRQHPR